MVEKNNIRQLCHKHFGYLKNDYGFESLSSTKKNELQFKSDSVGVRLEFDPREFYLFVTICKLDGNEFPPRPREIVPTTIISCFDLDDIVTLRSTKSLIPNHESISIGESISIEKVIQMQAQNLQKFADDILRADFSIFIELDRIVKNRARQSAIRRWGDGAVKYGWALNRKFE